jgi:hypothetical protein
VENDEYESLLAAFPDWETREVGKATSPKPILKKVKRFLGVERTRFEGKRHSEVFLVS